MSNFALVEFRKPLPKDLSAEDIERLESIEKVLIQMPSIQVDQTLIVMIIGYMFGQVSADAVISLGWLYQDQRMDSGKSTGKIYVGDDPTRDKRVTLEDVSGKLLSFQETLHGSVKVIYFMEQTMLSRTTRPRLAKIQGGKR